MAQKALKPLFNEIVDAIHDRDGLSDGISAQDFPNRIRAIPTGVTLFSIEVTTPPDRITYIPGDVFDYSGMVITATLSNGNTFLVDNEMLTFNPSVIAEEDTAIQISFEWGGSTKNTTQLITVNATIGSIFGVEWDGTATTKWSRTDASQFFSDPVPYVQGSKVYSSPFDTIYPWSELKVEERTGGTMVSIPKFYYNITKDGTKIKIQISDQPTEGFYTSPAHIDRKDGKGERNFVYISRYQCTSDCKSKSGAFPRADTNYISYVNAVKSSNLNIYIVDYTVLFTIWLLYIVEFSDFDSQKVIGYGGRTDKKVIITGKTDSMPYHTGTTLQNRSEYGGGVQYRNIEGLWSNCLTYVSGFVNSSNGVAIVLNPDNFYDYNAGTSGNGILLQKIPFSLKSPSNFDINLNAGFPIIIPTEFEGSTNTYATDQYISYGDDVYTVFANGGAYNENLNQGIMYMTQYKYDSGSYNIGFRSIEIP